MDKNAKLIEETTELIQILIDATTTTMRDFQACDKKYRSLKADLLSTDELRTRLPEFLVQSTTLGEISKYIRDHAPNEKSTTLSEQRRSYIGRAFQPATAFYTGARLPPQIKSFQQLYLAKNG